MSSSLTSAFRWRGMKWIGSSVLLSALLLGLIGFAHTPIGRPLLGWLASAAGCPVSLDGGDPITVEAFRAQQFARTRGTVSERSRPALGFVLGETTRAQALAQLGGAADCAWSREHTVLRCVDRGLRVSAGVAIDDLYLQFNAAGALVTVDALHAASDADVALQRLADRQAELDQQVGPLTDQSGVSNASHLTGGPLRRASIEYRYRGYTARISATNWGARGVRVREQYQWIGAPVGT